MKKLIFLFVALFFLTACNNLRAENIPFVKYETVDFVNNNFLKTYFGFIDMGLDVELSFGLSGVMNDIYVNEGDFVKKGKLLAKLDNDEYKLAIKRAKTELDDAKVKYNRAKSYFDRISKLHTAGGISYNDWEEAQTNLKSSRNRIEILTDALNIEINKESFSNIYAPYDGYIIKTYKDKMQYCSLGDKVILFQGAGMPEARIFVPENDINKITIGNSVVLRADSLPNKYYKGKVKSKVNSSINEGAYRVTVTILDDAHELLDGMSVSVDIQDMKQKPEIYINLSALSVNNDNKYVYILEKNNDTQGIVIKKEIQTGEILEGKIKILNGVNIGDLVVTEGVEKLSDGMRVRF